MLSGKLWWESSEKHSYFLGVCVSRPRPEVKLSKVECEVIDCGLGERRGVRAMEKGMSLISRDLQGETQGAVSFGIRSVSVSVTKMEVGRDVVGGLGSKSKKRELIVRDA